MFVPRPNNRSTRRVLMLLMLVPLLASCARSLPVYVPPAAIPALPAEARQPSTPSVCLSTCSRGWNQLVGKSLNTLTGLE